MASASSDGIGTNPSVIFDHGKEAVPISVHFPSGADTVHINGSNLKKALGVLSSNVQNIDGITIGTCQNQHPTDPVALVVKEGAPGDTTILPTHSRVIGVRPDGLTMAAHAIVPSGTHTINQKHDFCELVDRGSSTTTYTHPSSVSAEDHARNATRALKWNRHVGVTSEELDEHVVIAEQGGTKRVALAMDANAGPLGQLVCDKSPQELEIMFPNSNFSEPVEFENPKLGKSVPHLVMTQKDWESGKKTFVNNMKPQFAHHGLTVSRSMLTDADNSHPFDAQLIVHRRPHPICLDGTDFKARTVHEASETAGVPISTALASTDASSAAKQDIVAAAIFGASCNDEAAPLSTGVAATIVNSTPTPDAEGADAAIVIDGGIDHE